MNRQIQHLPPDRVVAALDTRPTGLTVSEAAERRAEVGANTIEVERRFWWLQSLAAQFTNFFGLLLDLSAGLRFVAEYLQPGENMYLLGWALLAVSVLNSLFSFLQVYRAERAMEELRKFLPRKVVVIRDGREFELLAEDLVPGDVLRIGEGDRVPADARLIECNGLLVNNAPLTGESRAVELSSESVTGPIAEANNVVLAGCQILRGTGVAVVFATGFRTEFGRIATLSHEVRREASPLERETAHMVRVLTLIAVGMGLVFFAYGVFTGRSLWVNLVFMMGIIVANVPEGLLPTFTLSLAMGSLRMARRNVLVKGLNAVEALGAVHVICTDKTGTLTENRLAIGLLVDPAAGQAVTTRDWRAAMLELAMCASEVHRGGETLRGDPVDVAVAEHLAREGGNPDSVANAAICRFPFDLQKRRSAGVMHHGGGAVFTVKGAWESLRPFVAEIEAANGVAVNADEKVLARADAIFADLAAAAYRVIAVAYRRLDVAPGDGASQDDFERSLVLKGFLALEDPVRAEVPAAVAACHGAGIRVVMITGDHPETALAVARRAGIVGADAGAGLCVTGTELGAMRRHDLAARLREGACIFARTTPEQKWKIVAALHDLDHVVAVTGDGVNDAPALRAADVGIAMGRGGTDVAREAAQVILLDDNFASIVSGVEEGRTIFNNIRKFTNYVLVSNGPEILPYLIYMLFPVPLALTIIQILSIDLGTDIVPSMALGREPPDKDVLREPPRERRGSLLTWRVMAHSYLFLGLIEAAFSLALFFWVLTAGGWQWGQDLGPADPLYRSATGIALASILLMQIGNLFGRRSRFGSGIDRQAFRNPLLVAGILIEIVFAWAILYFPPVQHVLGTGPVPLYVYAVAWLGAPLIFGLDFARKQIAKRLPMAAWGPVSP